jgi:hypothetical protein
VQVIVLLMLMAGPPLRLPVTVELKQDVQVTDETQVTMQRGTLHLEGAGTTKPLRLKKGQRFQMIAVGLEGSCRLKVPVWDG